MHAAAGIGGRVTVGVGVIVGVNVIVGVYVSVGVRVLVGVSARVGEITWIVVGVTDGRSARVSEGRATCVSAIAV
jgi:UDP-3-O-[3-hydroxymyristoyl] glucosamine N-acyltransferase